jgi:hypothetical protein
MTNHAKKAIPLIAALTLSSALFNVAFADEVVAPVAPVAAPMATQVAAPAAIPPGTEVIVKTIDAMNSQTAKLGDHFAVEVSKDVLVGDQVVIPAGIRGSGTVVFARKKGTMGKSGALDVRIDYIDLPSGRLKLKASDNLRGTNRSNSALGVTIAFGGLFALAVHGDDISMPAGTEMLAAVSAMPMAAPQPAPVAMAAAVTPAPSMQPTTTTSAAATPVTPADAPAPTTTP